MRQSGLWVAMYMGSFQVDYNWTLLLVRIILGSIMIDYGWPKVKNLRANTAYFKSIGYQPAFLWGTIVAFTEFIGGLAVILGIYTGWFAALFSFEMLVGFLWKHKTGKKFSGYSYDLSLLGLALVIMTFGSGIYGVLYSGKSFFLRWDFVFFAFVGALVLVYASNERN